MLHQPYHFQHFTPQLLTHTYNIDIIDFLQIMVTCFSYSSTSCHSFSGMGAVAMCVAPSSACMHDNNVIDPIEQPQRCAAELLPEIIQFCYYCANSAPYH